ncbi:MAG: helix-turn-helix transcriptional regulator [Candidatus Azobacteroides sp.]|nr:helix-turn-helix transcriptional regulator [Candidatus Azobacteroides sp.]
MYKSKLIETRKCLGFSQEKIAEALHMDVSCYSRREKGQIKISSEQWQKLRKS